MSRGWLKKLKGFLADLDREYVGTADESPSRWDEFLHQIAAEIERVMREEMLSPPNEPVYVPPGYVVFLSREDDAALRGEKRIGFVRGLQNLTAMRAREITRGRHHTESFAIQIRVDGSLPPGQFSVTPIWHRDEQKTTLLGPAPPGGQTTPLEMKPQDEETRVIAPYRLVVEVSTREGGEKTVRAFSLPVVTIGRGGTTVAVDLELPGDLEISRRHARLQRQAANRWMLVVEGRNPLTLNGREMEAGEEAAIAPGDEIGIGRYCVRVIELT
ncbi:MAG TPA: FHA domain-containing protein [Blastocatellia bacterium]|nr:FHA domain-containing protein [Blastocatellia bacterium]